MNTKLLDLLTCPVCNGSLIYDKEAQELICRLDRLAYPVNDDMPALLKEEARELPADEEIAD